MLRNNNSFDYTKWDYYTSSSESEENEEEKKEPVLPNNDPNF